ncbi:TraM recognition domain-containing protein [bacterium]|nr:TraM recognition domain-containing protein [bacterium]
MVTKIQIDAMSRADIPMEERRDFYLYIDEFQNFATKAFATILSEARKYRLSLIVANQFTSQLQEEVKDAIFGNVGTIMAFTL